LSIDPSQYLTLSPTEATIELATRLRNWLSKRPEPLPQFKIKKLGLATLRKAVKSMKGKRVHGRDENDSYIPEPAAPPIVDSLLHLVNLSNESQHFATPWNPPLILLFLRRKKNQRSKTTGQCPSK
jgi:hypothetical protein